MAGSAARGRRQRKKTKHYTDDDPSTFTTKEKTGMNGARVERPPSPVVVVKKRPRPSKRSHPRLPVPRPTVSLSHYVRIEPLFSSNEPQHSVIHGRGLGIPPPLKKPDWEQLQQPTSYFPGEPSRPVVASCTCLASDANYLAMGDTAGFISIYVVHPKLLCVSRLDSSASNREQESELHVPPSKKFGMYQKKSHPNQIERVALQGERVAVASRDEVELLDMTNNKILWSFPLDMSVHSLDIHPETYEVLVSFSSDNKMEGSLSPLWLLETVVVGGKCTVKQTYVEPRAKASLSLGSRCAGIWNKSNTQSILMVTLLERDDGTADQELLKLNKSSFEVLQQTLVPNKPVGKSSTHTIESLSQSPSGHLTLVSSTKGIRLLETSTFNLIRVFGDSVSLHGHSLMFQQCLFLPKPTLDTEMVDLLEARDKSKDINDKDWIKHNSAWILGIPFGNREPRELRDTLHLWDLWEGKHTARTVLAPDKAEGLVSVEYVSNILVATTQTGACYTMIPKMESDYPGIMYPPGYQVINDNVEYIEDEDEVDQVPFNADLEQDHDDDADEDQIAEALRLSMMQTEENVDINVNDGKNQGFVLPCHPEPFLKRSFEDGSSPMSVESKENARQASFASSLLLPMPHAKIAKQDVPVEEPKTIISKQMRAKRTKAASFETLLRNSVNPDLRKAMMARQGWAKGFGTYIGSKRSFHHILTHDKTKKATEGADNAHVSPFERSPLVGTTLVDSAHLTNRVEDQSNEYEKEVESRSLEDSQAHCIDLEKSKMDAVSALLMSACGELDSPEKAFASTALSSDMQVTKDIIVTESPLASSSSLTTLRLPSSKECRACMGRFVFHECGKKDKPIDYEQLARVEEAKKEKEEEEKRRARTEKRRLADAKRREAKKKKKIEDEARVRREAMNRIRWEKATQHEEVERNRVQSEDKDRRRADMLLRLQAEASTACSTSDWPQTVPSYPKEEDDTNDSYQQGYSCAQQDPQPTHGFQGSHNGPRQSDWPSETHLSMVSRNTSATKNPYSTDWSVHANREKEQFLEVENSNIYHGGDWPQPVETRHDDSPTTSNTAPPLRRAAQGWSGSDAAGSDFQTENPRTNSSPSAAAGDSQTKVAEDLYSSGAYDSVTAPIEAKPPSNTVTSQFPSTYYNALPNVRVTKEVGVEVEFEARNFNSLPAPRVDKTETDLVNNTFSSNRTGSTLAVIPIDEMAKSDGKDTFAVDNSAIYYDVDSAPPAESRVSVNATIQYTRNYYSNFTHVATPETIDPADALASLAAFATAAPMADVSGHYSSQATCVVDNCMVYPENPQVTEHNELEPPSHGFNGNSWANHKEGHAQGTNGFCNDTI